MLNADKIQAHLNTHGVLLADYWDDKVHKRMRLHNGDFVVQIDDGSEAGLEVVYSGDLEGAVRFYNQIKLQVDGILVDDVLAYLNGQGIRLATSAEATLCKELRLRGSAFVVVRRWAGVDDAFDEKAGFEDVYSGDLEEAVRRYNQLP